MKPKRRLEPGEVAVNPVAAKRYSSVKAKTSSNGVQIDQLPAAAIGQLVQAVVMGGDAVMLSHTRSGAAIRVCVFVGAEKFTYYANDVDEAESLVENLKFAAETAPETF